ncbi:hypothetical protein PanWU01x14_111420, partial [Parasponia andersonii]
PRKQNNKENLIFLLPFNFSWQPNRAHQFQKFNLITYINRTIKKRNDLPTRWLNKNRLDPFFINFSTMVVKLGLDVLDLSLEERLEGLDLTKALEDDEICVGTRD